jgi:hypothetical protein
MAGAERAGVDKELAQRRVSPEQLLLEPGRHGRQLRAEALGR